MMQKILQLPKMTPKEKIKYVKDKINELAEISPTGSLHLRLYTLTEYEDGPTLLSAHEQWSIIQKFQEEGFIQNTKLDEDKHGVWFEMVSHNENRREHPIIREQTLEHIARHLGDSGSGSQIVGWLQSWSVPDSLIEYPNTKWRMVYSILSYYAYSEKKKDNKMLFKIISEILHPIMYNGDRKAAEATAEDFNKYLEYDGLVAVSNHKNEYEVCEAKNLIEVDENDILQEENEELLQQEYNELEFLRLPENKEKISTLRKAYQVFMNIAEVFCSNPSKPSHELNDAYVKTKKLITDTVRDLRLYTNGVNKKQRIHTLTHYFIPFNNLFTAEKEYTPDSFEIDLSGKKLSWNYIRPQMNATYGDIDELYRKVEGSDILSKPDIQQTLNDVSLLLSKTKEEHKKTAKTKQNISASQAPVQKIEITAMPKLQVENTSRNPYQESGKREAPIELPFPEPVQWEKVTLKIKDGQQELEIFYDNNHIITADYVRLGFFSGKKQQKQDRQWGFLCALATLAATDIKQATAENMRNMVTTGKTLSINNVQQAKKSFVERLKDIFQTRNNPFRDTRDYYEPRFTILPEPSLRREKMWPQGGPLNENRAGDEADCLAYEEKRIQEETL